MIEAIFEIVSAIVAMVVSAVSSLIEIIASLFVTAGETLSAGEAIASLFSLIAELIWWFILIIVELIVALFTLRKPKKIKKPYFRKESNDSKKEQ